MLLHRLLQRAIRLGTLRVREPAGRETVFGDGGEPSCAIRFHDRLTPWLIALNPGLRIAEAYMDGRLTIEAGDPRRVAQLFALNYERMDRQPLVRAISHLLRRSRHFKQFNSMGRARRNVAHHYDLSGRLYDLFLDGDRQYSCGYFDDPASSLDEAQLAKKRHIAAKLFLCEPDLHVLDIGSGWGGLGLYLSRAAECDVTGVTLSVEQHRTSSERAQAAGLDRRCRFLLQDHREQREPYDRIVSVGMFEHVGKRNYDEFFAKVRDLLSDDGVCLLHTVGRFGEPAPVNPFIRKYIFPGTDVPALSEMARAIERSGLYLTDVEVLRLHYAETLKAWYERFQDNRAQAAALYDERFCRMWELYLAGCEMGFRHQGLNVFQVQLSKRIDTLPLTRDYIRDWETAHAAEPQVCAAE